MKIACYLAISTFYGAHSILGNGSSYFVLAGLYFLLAAYEFKYRKNNSKRDGGKKTPHMK